MPIISIIMGIYNCERTLSEAIDSILEQTFSNWELIMCDDGSTDNTFLLAEKYANKFPERITLIRNNTNSGLSYTLNRCLKLAKGEYIARMDGDDVSLPKRLEMEYSFLTDHPEYAIVSTDMALFDDNGIWGQTHCIEIPSIPSLVSGPPHCHAACLVKKEAYLAIGGYSESKRYERVEDRELWCRMYHAGYRGANIAIPLYKMRDDQNAIKRRKLRYRINGARVGLDVVRLFKLPFYYKVLALMPIAIGMLPRPLYRVLHRYRIHT